MHILIPVILLVLHVLLVQGVVDPPEVPVLSPGHQLSLDVCVLEDMGPGVQRLLLEFFCSNC